MYPQTLYFSSMFFVTASIFSCRDIFLAAAVFFLTSVVEAEMLWVTESLNIKT